MTGVLVVLAIVVLVAVWWRWASRNGCGRTSCPQCHGQRRLPKKQPSFAWILLVVVAGEIVDLVPRRWLPDSFVAWYNRSLDSWTGHP